MRNQDCTQPTKALDYTKGFQDYQNVNAKPKKRVSTRILHFGMGGVLLVLGTLMENQAAAQVSSVIANQVPQAPLQTQQQQEEPSEMDVFAPTTPPSEASLPRIFRYGPVQLRPFLDYRFNYGSGILSAPGSSQNSIIQEVSPGLLIDLGRNWVVSYSPTFRFYSANEFQNGVDQNLALIGSVSYEAWTFGLSQIVQLTSQPLAQTGSQTGQSTYSTTLSANYAFNSRWTTDLSLYQDINLISGFQNSYDWGTMDWLNYVFNSRLNAGLGAGAGYVLLNSNSQSNTNLFNNPNQTYQEVQGRVNWRATDKVSFQLNAGMDIRQYQAAGFNNTLTPLFGLTIQYQPVKATQIAVTAGRSVGPSDYFLGAQQSVATSVNASLTQRLFRDYSLEVGGGYSVTDYNSPFNGSENNAPPTGFGNNTGNNTIRSDDEISFNVQLSHPFLKRGTWAIFYQYVRNNSTLSSFSFLSSQVGFQLTYAY